VQAAFVECGDDVVQVHVERVIVGQHHGGGLSIPRAAGCEYRGGNDAQRHREYGSPDVLHVGDLYSWVAEL
jgi:hypothetical protein